MLLVQSGVTTSAPTRCRYRLCVADRPLRSGTGRSRCGSRSGPPSSAPIMPASVMPNVSRTSRPNGARACRAWRPTAARPSRSPSRPPCREIDAALIGKIGEMQAVARHAHPDRRLRAARSIRAAGPRASWCRRPPITAMPRVPPRPAPSSGRPGECRAETRNAPVAAVADRDAGAIDKRAESRSSRLRCRTGCADRIAAGRWCRPSANTRRGCRAVAEQGCHRRVAEIVVERSSVSPRSRSLSRSGFSSTRRDRRAARRRSACP